jgi:DNA-binding GntR family transcriptional regulator
LLEGRAAEMAATRMDERTLTGLCAAAHQLNTTEGSVDWQQRWIHFDEDLHGTIAHASGNRRLWMDIARYRLLQRGLHLLAGNIECLKQASGEHDQILDALRQRNAKEAAAAMVSHIETWQVYFVKTFPR